MSAKPESISLFHSSDREREGGKEKEEKTVNNLINSTQFIVILCNAHIQCARVPTDWNVAFFA